MLKIRNTQINYEIIGEGKPIIFFNGFMNDMSIMKKYLEPIFENKTNWQRIYVDHIGVGNTIIGEDVKDFNDVLEIMLSFVDKVVKEKNFVIGGYSFGGYLSRYILDNRFEKIDGMLLITPLIDSDYNNIDVDRTIKVVKYKDTEVQDKIDNKIQLDFYGSMQNCNEEFLQNLMNNSKSINLKLDSFDKFDKPVLIITGRQDNEVGYKDAFKILKKYPRATYISMDKCGHASQVEQSIVFKTLINEWIYRLEELM